jgi:hypothetical protein
MPSRTEPLPHHVLARPMHLPLPQSKGEARRCALVGVGAHMGRPHACVRARVRVLCMRRLTSPLQFASRIADAVRACKMRGNASPALSSIVCCDVAQCSAAWSSVVGRIALRALSAICRRHIDAIRRGPFKPVPT